jgi:hypothetical protein
MDRRLLQTISTEFKQLIPQDETTTLLLVSLHLKIKNQLIEEPFSQKDFDDTIDEIAEILQIEKEIQKETIAKKIRKYFFIPVKGKNPYELTVFTKDFCEMILDQVNPIIGKLELYYTFKKTLPIEETDLENIELFEYWFNHNFIPARKTIKHHIEELYRFVDEKIINLRELLKPDVIEPKKLIDDYINVFQELGEQTNDLTSTIAHKQDVIEKIKNAEDSFIEDINAFDRYVQCRSEIERFFDSIDNRIISINERIYIASSRLNALYDTLKHKNKYKVLLEKYLLFLIENSSNEKGEIILPVQIPLKSIAYDKVKFTTIPLIDFTDITGDDVPDYREDEELKAQIRRENIRILERQECVSKWLDYIHEGLKDGNSIEFYEILTSIQKEEDDIEIPINVCSNIIQQAEDKVLAIEITNDVLLNYGEITLWNMKIKPLIS